MNCGPRRTGVLMVVVAALAGSAACGSSTPAGVPAPVPSSTSTSTSSTSVPSPGLGFSDADNGRSVTVDAGQRITVILHSSDFVFAPASDVSVLREDGPPTVTLGGATCTDTATGCGTVVASFVAVGPGSAALTADRTDTHWILTVYVTGDVPPESTSSTAGDPPAPATGSEVRGTVLFSPVCPVERIPPDPACAPRPGPADIELVNPDGAVAATARAADDGTFALPAAPGRYDVRASVPGAAIGGGCQADPSEVAVAPGEVVTVTVTCDTGIR